MPGRDWLRSWWIRVPNPREISVVYTMIYAIALATGVSTLIIPPRTIANEVGTYAVVALGGLLIIGAIVGMLAGALENWRLERVGILFMVTAGVIYAAVVISLHYEEVTGSRLTQLGFISMALGSFIVRYLMIRRFTYRPRG